MEDKPIRILIIDGKLICGGVEAFLMNVYRHIDRNKIQFDFLVHYKERFFYDDEVEKLGGKVYRLTFRNDRNIIKYIHDLKSFFKEHKEYSIVWGHMDGLASIYLRIAKKSGVNTTICHSHTTGHEKSLKGIVKSVLKMNAYQYSDIKFACSTEAGEYLYGNREFTNIHNAIDIKKYQYNNMTRKEIRNQYNWNDKIVIGHIGRFFSEKNHEYLIKIFERICNLEDDFVLCLCGDGDDREKIFNMVKDKGLESKVLFLGNISNANDFYQAFDMFVLPSLYEGLPVTGVEAQTSGLKCFFSDTITREVNLVEENVKFLPIGDENIDIWVNEIIKNSQYTRIDKSQKIREKGYSIEDLSKNLEEFFVEEYNKNRIERKNI